jgi:hypothetical protein
MRAMFEYTKTLLKKVSFNLELFEKEYEKAKARLLPYEIDELNIYLKENFSNNNVVGDFVIEIDNKIKANSA